MRSPARRMVRDGAAATAGTCAAVADVAPCSDAPGSIADSYALRTGWDPRHEDAPHVYLIATPTSMQAWNSLAEIDGRTIMCNGQWAAV